jgi:hypothetical protein
MKKVTIEINYLVSDELSEMISEWPNDKVPSAYSFAYLQEHAKEVDVIIYPMQQMYNVKLENDAYPQNTTKDGFLSWHGEICNYTRGQAIKKARIFNGKVVKCEQ